MDTIRSRGLPVRRFTNSFFDFCWCYFNILLLVVLHLFCFFQNPICTFIVVYIFLSYSRPEFSSFFLMRNYILFMSILFYSVLISLASLPVLLYSVLIALKSGSLCFNPLLNFFSCSFIPFGFDSIKIIQPCHLTLLSQRFCIPSFNETNILAKCIYI